MTSTYEHWSNNRYYDNGSSSQWFFWGTNSMSLSTWKSRLEPSAISGQSSWKNQYASISGYAGSYSNFMSNAEKMQQGSFSGTYSAQGAINYVRNAFNWSSTSSSSGGTTVTQDTTRPYVTG